MEILKDTLDNPKTELSKIKIKTEIIDNNKHRRRKKMIKMKRLELIGRSKVDFMIRRQRDESIKELRLFRSEEMKKIDMEIKAMKHEMMSYMIKEIEEQKQTLMHQMMEDINNEKKKRMLIVESEYKLRNSSDKSVQTVKYPMTVNAKFDEILKELNEIKQMSKQNYDLHSSQNPSENENPREIKPILNTSQSSENSFDVLPNKSSQEDSEKAIANSSNSLFTDIVIKEESEDNEASCTPPPEVTLVPDDDTCTASEDKEIYAQTYSRSEAELISFENYKKKSQEKRQYLSNKDISFSQNNFQNSNSDESFTSSQKGMLISVPLDFTSTNNLKRKFIQDNSSVNSQSHSSEQSYVDFSHRMLLTNSNSTSSQLTPTSKATMIQTGGSRTSFIKNNPQLFSNTLHSITPKIKSYGSLTEQKQRQQQQHQQEPSRFQNTMAYRTNTSSSSNFNAQNILANWKRDNAGLSNDVSYDIYAHTKKIITSQNEEERFHHRKKREINRRILEKYGPLPNVIEVCEKVQSDPMYLGLNVKEKEGILSCIERSVAERANFAKDLLEELFSREALSISSCKGSSLKTALDAERLEFIRRIVFIAMPSDEEDSMWDMIQECIDTKCRGILRNMKKKLKKSFEY